MVACEGIVAKEVEAGDHQSAAEAAAASQPSIGLQAQQDALAGKDHAVHQLQQRGQDRRGPRRSLHRLDRRVHAHQRQAKQLQHAKENSEAGAPEIKS